jgi:hypothetical protein
MKITLNILKEIFNLTFKLTVLQQKECRHLNIENASRIILKELLDVIKNYKE